MPKPLMVDTDPGFDALVLPTTEHLRTIARRMDVMTPEKSGWAEDVRDAARALDALRKAVEEKQRDAQLLLSALETYAIHDNSCIAGQWRKGEPVGDDKYRNLYGHGAKEKWYYGKERPPCKCGLDDALAQRGEDQS